MNQISYRIEPERADLLKTFFVSQHVGVQHFFEAVTDMVIQFSKDEAPPRTATEVRRLLSRAKELKQFKREAR